MRTRRRRISVRMKLNELKYIAGLTAIISLMAGSSLCGYAEAEAQAEAKAEAKAAKKALKLQAKAERDEEKANE